MVQVTTVENVNFVHQILVDEQLIQEISCEDGNNDLEYLLKKYGLKPHPNLFKELDEHDIMKKYTKVNKQGRFYNCLVTVRNDKMIKGIKPFVIRSLQPLPDAIFVYGRSHRDENSIYCNYWTDELICRIKEGYIRKYTPSYLESKPELFAIGLPFDFRERHFDTIQDKEEEMKNLIKALFI
jgi:hypothetical protein